MPTYFLNCIEREKAIGLFNKKYETNRKYVYNHKVEIDEELPVDEMDDFPHLHFLHLLWNFNFKDALLVLKTKLIQSEEYSEGEHLIPILE